MKYKHQINSTCKDSIRNGNDCLIATCLPHIILTVVESITAADSISGSLSDTEEIVDPDHPP